MISPILGSLLLVALRGEPRLALLKQKERKARRDFSRARARDEQQGPQDRGNEHSLTFGTGRNQEINCPKQAKNPDFKVFGAKIESSISQT